MKPVKMKSNRVKVKRPIAISGLSTMMIGSSLILIYTRIQNLRSLPSLRPFIETIQKSDSGLLIGDSSIVNVPFFLDFAILSTSLVPLILGVGLWNLYAWGRTISVCLLASVLIPNVLAAIGLISDRGATVGANLGISLACAVGLVILQHPNIIASFKSKRAIG
jgi:hypothetical protein